jgi:predicted MFS family arabinose efflux permease
LTRDAIRYSQANVLIRAGSVAILASIPKGHLAAYGWNEQRVGIALTVGGIAGVLTQTPAGALVDRLRAKRALIAAAIVALGAGALLAPKPLIRRMLWTPRPHWTMSGTGALRSKLDDGVRTPVKAF